MSRLDGEVHYLNGKTCAKADIAAGKSLEDLRAGWENGQCGDSYDRGYNEVLREAERQKAIDISTEC